MFGTVAGDYLAVGRLPLVDIHYATVLLHMLLRMSRLLLQNCILMSRVHTCRLHCCWQTLIDAVSEPTVIMNEALHVGRSVLSTASTLLDSAVHVDGSIPSAASNLFSADCTPINELPTLHAHLLLNDIGHNSCGISRSGRSCQLQVCGCICCVHVD